MNICGKGIGRFDPMTGQAEELMRRIRINDTNRMREMIGRLETVFAAAGIPTGLNNDTIRDGIAHKYGVRPEQVYLQERHVAQAFQEAFFSLVAPQERIMKLEDILGVPSKAAPDNAVRIQGEIRAHLMRVGKQAYVAEQFLNFDDAVKLILELGGIPSYPTLADGASPICAYETPVEKLVQTLVESGIYCAEFIPVRNEPSVLEHYVQAMRAAGIVVTGGTEHNTLDLISMEPKCLRGTPVPRSIRHIFSEGACVVAAHQFLTNRGECGYVGPDGMPNPGFSNAETRISFFRGLGAALIAGYHEQSPN